MLEICKLLLFFFIGFYTFKWMSINKCSQTLKFVFWLVFLRLVFASFHEVTYPQIFGSFSIISIYSILLVCTSAIFMYLKNISVIRNDGFYGIKLMIFLMFLTSVINSNQIQSIASIIKWIFLLQLSIMFIESIKYDGVAKVLKVMSIAYSYPVILVLLSIILGVSKATEVDGSISYVGGYYHEGIISVVILSAMSIFLLMAAEHDKRYEQFYLIAFFGYLLVMINYRTTFLASLFICAFVLLVIYKDNNKQILNKTIISIIIFMIVMGTMMFSPFHLFERLQELPEAVSQYSRFLKFPEYYSSEERQFFSGRIYLWSAYISDALDGTYIQIFFGQGMDAWKKTYDVYAHNTFVSFFYELGVFGVGMFSLIIVNIYRRISQIRKSHISILLCGVYTAFLVVNLGTMPLWQLEGIILFSLIIATTEYYAHREKKSLKSKQLTKYVRAELGFQKQNFKP